MMFCIYTAVEVPGSFFSCHSVLTVDVLASPPLSAQLIDINALCRYACLPSCLPGSLSLTFVSRRRGQNGKNITFYSRGWNAIQTQQLWMELQQWMELTVASIVKSHAFLAADKECSPMYTQYPMYASTLDSKNTWCPCTFSLAFLP